VPSMRRRSAASAHRSEGGVSSGRASARGSNSRRAGALTDLGPQPESGGGSLDAAFDAILGGEWDAAQDGAHTAAEAARTSGDAASAVLAGIVWQVADAFEAAHTAMTDKDYAGAKGHASRAANRARALGASGELDAEDIQAAVDAAGKTWTLADKAAAAARGKGGRDAPMLDQHELDHWNRGAFCGLATLIMMLRANGQRQGSDTASLNGLASEVYVPRKGSSGADMAGLLRERGLSGSTFTTSGTTAHVLDTLDQGQTVPFGVVLTEGTVTKLEGGASTRYPHRRVGDVHFRQFGPSGHWVLITRYEGPREKPTAYRVNDPDLGGEMRCTPDQLARMGGGSGAFYAIHQ